MTEFAFESANYIRPADQVIRETLLSYYDSNIYADNIDPNILDESIRYYTEHQENIKKQMADEQRYSKQVETLIYEYEEKEKQFIELEKIQKESNIQIRNELLIPLKRYTCYVFDRCDYDYLLQCADAYCNLETHKIILNECIYGKLMDFLNNKKNRMNIDYILQIKSLLDYEIESDVAYDSDYEYCDNEDDN